jgi:hypothetical protein
MTSGYTSRTALVTWAVGPIPLRWLQRTSGDDREDTERTGGVEVTETTEPTIIEEAKAIEAKAIIDKGLAAMLHRELVSTDEVADLLLDIRSLLDTESAAQVN